MSSFRFKSISYLNKKKKKKNSLTLLIFFFQSSWLSFIFKETLMLNKWWVWCTHFQRDMIKWCTVFYQLRNESSMLRSKSGDLVMKITRLHLVWYTIFFERYIRLYTAMTYLSWSPRYQPSIPFYHWLSIKIHSWSQYIGKISIPVLHHIVVIQHMNVSLIENSFVYHGSNFHWLS